MEQAEELNQKYSFTLYDAENDIINLYHAVIGTKGKAYCSTSGEKLIKVCPETGKILKQFSWLPGIIITGCDFSGSKLSGERSQEISCLMSKH